MSERVEISKAVVSINAVMVDGKAMTIAVFEQIPYVTVEGLARDGVRPDRLSVIGWVNRENTTLFTRDGVLMRTALGDSPRAAFRREDRLCCEKCAPLAEYQKRQCEECIRVRNAGLPIIDRLRECPQVYIAVGGAR